jgi:hypothetical protein
MLREPTPHITTSGRYLLGTVGLVAGVLLLSVLIISCSRTARLQARAERPWDQGYETPQGYMQPDHSFFYYWMMTSTFRQPQPSYHLYVPPPDYPSHYRPWLDYDRTTRTVRERPRAAAPAASSYTPREAPTRDNGGFAPKAAPRRETPTRDNGGFSRSTPAARPAPTRDTGGFAPKAPPRAAPPRAAPSRPAPSRPAPTRSSGGFAPKPRTP